MKSSRNTMRILGGISAVVIAVIMLAMAGLMAALEQGRQGLLFAVISVFPILVAIACLSPSARNFALRLVGAITCVSVTGTLIMTFVAPPEDVTFGRRGLLVALAVASGAMAIKGRWPGPTAEQPGAAQPGTGEFETLQPRQQQ